MSDLSCFSYTDPCFLLAQASLLPAPQACALVATSKSAWRTEKVRSKKLSVSGGTGCVNSTLQVIHLCQVFRVLQSISCATFDAHQTKLVS